MKAVTRPHEHALPAKDITESSTRDEEDCIRQPITCDDQLYVGKRRMQVGADGRNRHIHDEEIEASEKGSGEDNRKRTPPARIGGI